MSRLPAAELAALRRELGGRSGPGMWRSLDALAGTPAFRQFLEAEFPAAARLADGPDRRRFLGLMAASLSLAGLTGCGDDVPDGRAQEVPYVRNPERVEAGQKLLYASTVPFDGFGNGVLVTTRDGRPLKVEGNDRHPWSRGGTDTTGQAAILGLWDPGRAQAVQHLGRTSSWQGFRGATVGQLASLRAVGGRGVRLLTGPVTSPSLAAQVAALRTALPELAWHAHAAAGREAALEGARRAFGRPLETRLRFDRARVVVALDGDFLDPGPLQVGTARGWADARRAASADGRLLALHAASPTPSLTVAKADHPLVASPALLPALARALLADAQAGRASPAADGSTAEAWRARASAALLSARGAGIVLAGAAQPPEVHELAHRINATLGNGGATVWHTEPVVAPAADLASLAGDMQAGRVTALLCLDCNPAYDAPADLGFGAAMDRVPLRISAGLYNDETGARSDWHLPLAHPLESWGDLRSPDGTAGLLQPTVAPLYGGRTVPEVLSLMFEDQPRDGLALLQAHWAAHGLPADEERTGGALAGPGGRTGSPAPGTAWRRALEDGFVAGTALPEVAATPVASATGTSGGTTSRSAGAATTAPPAAAPPAPGATPQALTVLFRPDASIWDGALAPNAWLQELPRPLSKLVWENAVHVAPELAARMGIGGGDVLTLSVGGRSVQGSAFVTPGQAPDAVTLTLGYGRVMPGGIADRIGYDAYAVRSAASPWQQSGATLSRTGARHPLVTTQDHGTMEGHDLIRVQPLGGAPVGDHGGPLPTLYPAREGDGRAWGMVIDLDSCIGCNSCVVGCQSENNIAVVGREQVALGREMHWLRIDRYYEGEVAAPATRFQPVPCMQCEDAPCEVGCPVEATVHDHEGLNLMVYNRCVGTRACSGYCPYKVRHFNWFDYSAGASPSMQQGRNPDVTVRAAGVMEKCTYCVQRIAEARITADKGDGTIPTDSVQTACQAACPTRAISFGDLNQPGAAVRALRSEDRHYALLGELNVKPRTTYLAALAPEQGA